MRESPYRIAIVEDDVETSRFIGDALHESGYETVSYFRPSSDILEHLSAYSPDLVIMDARLNSSVDGWDIIEALKGDERTAAIRIVVCSGATGEIAAHQSLLERYGVPVLPKPFDLKELDAVVERTLAR